MAKFKLEEKLFLSKAIISNVHSMRLKNRYSDNERNEELVDESIELAVLMLKKRNLLFGESEKKKVQKPELFEVDFEEIIDIFNLYCEDLPKVTKLTKERENLIKKILETHTTQDIGTVFNLTKESDFLSGRKTDWKANFNWIMDKENFIKILEGNYKNNENGKQQQRQPLFGRQDADTFLANTTGWTDSE